MRARGNSNDEVVNFIKIVTLFMTLQTVWNNQSAHKLTKTTIL